MVSSVKRHVVAFCATIGVIALLATPAHGDGDGSPSSPVQASVASPGAHFFGPSNCRARATLFASVDRGLTDAVLQPNSGCAVLAVRHNYQPNAPTGPVWTSWRATGAGTFIYSHANLPVIRFSQHYVEV